MNNKTREKIRLSEKVGFILANYGNIPIITLVSSFLMIFYTNVVGLNPAAVATLFLIARIADGINDPLVGFLIDHSPVGKIGRFRRGLIFGTVICGLNYIMLWFGPIWMPGIKLLIAYVSYLLIGLTFPIMDISLNSMLPVMTDNLEERNVLSSIKGISYMTGTLIIGIAAPLVIAGGTLEAYYSLIFPVVAIVLLFSISGAVLMRENATLSAQEQNQYKIKDLIAIFIKRPVAVTFLAGLFWATGVLMISTVDVYFFTYIIGDIKLLSTAGIVGFIGIIPAIILSPVLIGKFGKKIVNIMGYLIFIGSLLIRLFDPTSITLAFTGKAFSGLGMGLNFVLLYGIQADNTNFVEYIRNTRVEGAIASMSSFVTKAAQGIGGALPGYILAATGFSAGAAVQSTATNQGIIFSALILPATALVIAAAVFGFGYNIKKKELTELNEALKMRHGDL